MSRDRDLHGRRFCTAVPRRGGRHARQLLAGLLLAALCAAAAGQPLRQFARPPAPVAAAAATAPQPSGAEEELAYRKDAARHLYNLYGPSVFRGRLPPLLYSVMVVETQIDAAGAVVAVDVVRRPAAAEVEPWVTTMIRQASPFPAPARLPGGTARYVEIWLVDKSGRFQVDSLTEGQR